MRIATQAMVLAFLASVATNFSQAKLEINDADLRLNGRYVYRFLGLYKLFEISLYLKEGYEIDNFPIKQPLSLKFIYNRSFTRDQLISQGNKALAVEATEEERKRYARALADLNSVYKDVVKGDCYRLDFRPDYGLSLSLNREMLVTIRDPGFGEYYLRIWLGKREGCQTIIKSLIPQIGKSKSGT